MAVRKVVEKPHIKIKELIAKLNEIDPTGEEPVWLSNWEYEMSHIYLDNINETGKGIEISYSKED